MLSIMPPQIIASLLFGQRAITGNRFWTDDMNPADDTLRTLFAKNRTEELGADVYKYFVVPPFFDKLDLRAARKPRLFIGGRGCGKTMLLRYLSHQSAFSQNRGSIPSDALEHIGLYWRVDTQFAALMNERGIADDVWSSGFNHFMAIFLGLELLRSINSVAQSNFPALSCSDVEKINFDRLMVFDPNFCGGIHKLMESFENKLWEFELWVANVRKGKEPVFLPGVQFLAALVSHVKQVLPALKPALFFVYVDEFENLLHYQKRILNTCIKHSEAPLIFNIAMKRHAFETVQTVGVESIQDIADYRKHDLEAYLLQTNFDVFAAEVLFLNLAQAGVCGIPVDVEKLRDPAELSFRREKAYQERVLARVREMFPGLTHEQLAKQVFENESLKRKIRDRIEKALLTRQSSISVEHFFRPELPQATITLTALLHRRKLAVEDVAHELVLLTEGKENKFTNGPGWVHNNFIGCLLWLYESHATVCPIFSGFDIFCHLSRGNLRHFLELCHTALNQVPDKMQAERFAVPQWLQARAARQASTAFLNEIPAFGPQGDRLHTFVFRLGLLFALAHRRPTQSEPEQSHFAITSGSKALTSENQNFLREAEKWSVLFEEKETKLKHDTQFASVEYVLNPVYAPYFNITYRKKRKLELSTDDLETLIHGSFDNATELLRRFSKQWEIEGESEQTLFFQFIHEP
jgi:hypothetical protein